MPYEKGQPLLEPPLSVVNSYFPKYRFSSPAKPLLCRASSKMPIVVTTDCKIQHHKKA